MESSVPTGGAWSSVPPPEWFTGKAQLLWAHLIPCVAEGSKTLQRPFSECTLDLGLREREFRVKGRREQDLVIR